MRTLNRRGALGSLTVAALILTACGGESAETVDGEAPAEEADGDASAEGAESPDEAAGESTPGGEIVIASWGGRFTEATVSALTEPFTEETGIEVTVVDHPVGMVSQIESMVDAGNVQWDILDSASAADAFYLYEQGLAAPLPEDTHEMLVNELGESRVTDFGFTWSTYGFITVCNLDTVEVCPEDSTGLFDPETYPGSRMLIGMPASFSQAITFLGMAAGNPVSDPLPVDLEEAAEILRGVRDDTRVWWTAGEQMEQAIRQGEADMGIMFSGRAFKLVDEGMNLKLIWDKGVYSPGYYVRIEGGPNPEGAQRFMEWIATNPEAQAEWAELMEYSVPHPEALEMVDEETASKLADQPEYYEKLAQQNVEWYLENREEIDEMLNTVIQGG